MAYLSSYSSCMTSSSISTYSNSYSLRSTIRDGAWADMYKPTLGKKYMRLSSSPFWMLTKCASFNHATSSTNSLVLRLGKGLTNKCKDMHEGHKTGCIWKTSFDQTTTYVYDFENLSNNVQQQKRMRSWVWMRQCHLHSQLLRAENLHMSNPSLNTVLTKGSHATIIRWERICSTTKSLGKQVCVQCSGLIQCALCQVHGRANQSSRQPCMFPPRIYHACESKHTTETKACLNPCNNLKTTNTLGSDFFNQ